MKKTFRSSLLLFLLGLMLPAFAMAVPLSEPQKIEAMIHSVEILPGAQFVRNGSSYDGNAAARHLRMKLRYAGSRVKTAEDFITCCASKSSMSGKPYQIRFANGSFENADVYFHEFLKRLDSLPPTAANASASVSASASVMALKH